MFRNDYQGRFFSSGVLLYFFYMSSERRGEESCLHAVPWASTGDRWSFPDSPGHESSLSDVTQVCLVFKLSSGHILWKSAPPTILPIISSSHTSSPRPFRPTVPSALLWPSHPKEDTQNFYNPNLPPYGRHQKNVTSLFLREMKIKITAWYITHVLEWLKLKRHPSKCSGYTD